jgi:soluble lytic murein transglycosylase
MPRRILQFCVLLLIAAGLVGGWWYTHSADPRYEATEIICWQRYHRYDGLITSIARSRGLDPMLVKALIWRESRFHPDKRGTSGERGLMQVGPAAASEWAKAQHREGVTPDDLLDPRTNIEAGTWLLARALHRWQQRNTSDPVPFALAEYNAGHSRVERWAAGATDKERGTTPGPGVPLTGAALTAQIKIPSTRQYVETVVGRLRFYQVRGRF